MWQVIAIALGRLFSAETLKYFALKTLFITLMVIVFPTVLNNLVYGFIENSLNYYASFELPNSPSIVFQISGVGAYLASKFRLVEAFNLFITLVLLKYSFRLIPFLRL